QSAPSPRGSRSLQVMLACIVAIAFVGYFIGTRHVHTPRVAAVRPASAADHEYDGPVVPARRYQEMAEARFSPNRNWRSMLADLEQPTADLFDQVHLDERA